MAKARYASGTTITRSVHWEPKLHALIARRAAEMGLSFSDYVNQAMASKLDVALARSK